MLYTGCPASKTGAQLGPLFTGVGLGLRIRSIVKIKICLKRDECNKKKGKGDSRVPQVSCWDRLHQKCNVPLWNPEASELRIKTR